MDQTGVNFLSGDITDYRRQPGAAVLPEQKKRTGLAVLLRSMLKIGVIGFGGGSALIPVIEEEVVDRQGILSREEYNEAVVSACVTPGALPVEIAAGVGRKKAGIKGMILAALAMALPGAFLTVFILAAASKFEGAALNFIQYISIGLGGFISSLLASYAIKSAGEARNCGRRTYTASLLIMAGVFLVTGGKSLLQLFHIKGADRFIHLSTFQVLMLSFLIMSVLYIGKKLRHLAKAGYRSGHVSANEKRADRKAVVSILKETFAWVIFAALLAIPAFFILAGGPVYIFRGFLSSLMSFGGGDAYLSVADGLFVNTKMVSGSDFYGLLVPVANVLPGSILCKILTGTGYLIGSKGGFVPGIAGAVAGFAVSTAASGMVFGIVYWIFRTFENVSFFKMVSKWIRPIISGLLIGVIVTMLKTSAAAAAALGHGSMAAILLTLAIAAANLVLSGRKADHPLLLVGSAAAGAILLLF